MTNKDYGRFALTFDCKSEVKHDAHLFALPWRHVYGFRYGFCLGRPGELDWLAVVPPEVPSGE